jgi:hypothetical protein
MIKTKGFYLVLVVIIFVTGCFTVFGDDYILEESNRSYMGYTYPKKVSESWITDNKVYVKTSRFISITRYDLKKKWIILPEQKRYFEEPIDWPVQPDKNKDTQSKQSIHEVGWDYIPQFDWIIEKTDQKEDINGRECQKIIADGDADYEEKTIEIWVSKDAPINIERFNNMTLLANEEWKNIFQTSPELKKLFIVKTKHTIVNDIAPTMYYEETITKAETAAPPQNIYELPEGLEKVNSLRELYAR